MKFRPAILTLFLFVPILWLDIPKLLGAHPWWSIKVVLIGGPIGFVLATVLRRTSGKWPLIWFGLGLIVGFCAAYFGKQEFAASYGENQLAGQFWYFGWIATSAALAAFALTFFRVLAR